eukprot:3907434-Prorocentrum_lima.AAC.1
MPSVSQAVEQKRKGGRQAFNTHHREEVLSETPRALWLCSATLIACFSCFGASSMSSCTQLLFVEDS